MAAATLSVPKTQVDDKPSLSDRAGGLVALHASVQNYAWGMTPLDGSLVARLHTLNSGAQVNDDKPYAELWMGVHPSGPACLADDASVTLSKFIKDAVPSAKLPYLMKVLSVAKPLSIQAHPHKDLAVCLHRDNPKAYKDDNHKPEMCVALSDFEGMCNFRPLPEICSHLKEYPFLAELCGGSDSISAIEKASLTQEKREALRMAFSSLMTSDEDAIKLALDDTRSKVSSKNNLSDADKLFQRLCNDYPGDVGCFSAYLLNFLRIKSGQAFFMAANEPHAYLYGQCMEIMANSDNVVRAGLTPKFKDVDNLIQMLTYNDGPPAIMDGEAFDNYGTLYQPPVEEFQLTKYTIPADRKHELAPAKGIGLIFCLDGFGWISLSSKSTQRMTLSAGNLYYIPDSASVTIQSEHLPGENQSSDLLFFRAGINQSLNSA